MGRKRKINDLEGQMTLPFDWQRNLPSEGGEVNSRLAFWQDSQKSMEGKHELGDTGKLLEKAAHASNLWEAWVRVRANKGSAGIDGETIEDFDKKALGHIL